MQKVAVIYGYERMNGTRGIDRSVYHIKGEHPTAEELTNIERELTNLFAGRRDIEIMNVIRLEG